MPSTASILVLLVAGCGIQVSSAFNSTVNHTAELVVTDDLNSTLSDFKAIFSTADKGVDAIWALSKMVVTDSDAPSAPNLTIYSSSVYWNFTDDDYKQENPACEAYYAGTKCAECTLCAKYPHSPSNAWTLSDGAVYFDCSGIESLRRCRGSTGTRADEFEPGSTCDFSGSSFQGVSTCFVEYISPVPSQSPSHSPAMALVSSNPTSAAARRNPTAELGFGTSSAVAYLLLYMMGIFLE
jgi:hypothetical protein